LKEERRMVELKKLNRVKTGLRTGLRKGRENWLKEPRKPPTFLTPNFPKANPFQFRTNPLSTNSSNQFPQPTPFWLPKPSFFLPGPKEDPRKLSKKRRKKGIVKRKEFW